MKEGARMFLLKYPEGFLFPCGVRGFSRQLLCRHLAELPDNPAIRTSAIHFKQTMS